MSTFSETAREIVVDFWTYADKVSEAIAQWKKATGQYTAEYIHTQVLQLEQQSLDAKYQAERKLAALREKYETTAAAYYAPNGAVLDTADAKLLRTDFPMDLDQFRALCERNKDNATVMQLARQYAAKEGRNWGPWVSKVCPDSDHRRAAYEAIEARAYMDLNAGGSSYAVALMPDAWARMLGQSINALGSLNTYRGTVVESTAAPAAGADASDGAEGSAAANSAGE